FELFSDLLLADYLHLTTRVSHTTFHCKSQPWFVSDTTTRDFEWLLSALEDPVAFFGITAVPEASVSAMQALARRWKAYIKDGVWILESDPVWCTFWAHHHLEVESPHVFAQLQRAKLVVFKGDLNYRKLVYDCKFPATTPFADSIGGVTGLQGVLALRTNKSDPIVGLLEGVEERLEKEVGEGVWRWSGKLGVVEFYENQEKGGGGASAEEAEGKEVDERTAKYGFRFSSSKAERRFFDVLVNEEEEAASAADVDADDGASEEVLMADSDAFAAVAVAADEVDSGSGGSAQCLHVLVAQLIHVNRKQVKDKKHVECRAPIPSSPSACLPAEVRGAARLPATACPPVASDTPASSEEDDDGPVAPGKEEEGIMEEAMSIRLGLQRIHRLLLLLDNPQDKLNAVIHVAGTNGKGSVCALLTTILHRAANLKTARFSSPHFIHPTDAITINNLPIPTKEYDSLNRHVESVAKAHMHEDPPSLFEMECAVAFLWFANERVDVAVIEVGLGGRLDATNVITNALWVLTSLAIDHTEFLGPTIREIATEKAGILHPPCSDCVVGVQHAFPEAKDVICARAREVGCRVWEVEAACERVVGREGGNWVKGVVFGEEVVVDLPLLGTYQHTNLALALLTTTVFFTHKYPHLFPTPPTTLAIQNAIPHATWPGRMERIAISLGGPTLLADGAHNAHGARFLREYVDSEWPLGTPVVWVVGMKRDLEKRDTVLKELVRSGDEVWTMGFESPVGMPWVKAMEGWEGHSDGLHDIATPHCIGAQAT
ncbi:hypothetical protein HDU98_011206, partial [Podochytrium sp. JEL0797]